MPQRPNDNSLSRWEKAAFWLQIFYMIRVPILLAAAIFLFPLVVVWTAPTFLRGLYDFADQPFKNTFWLSLFVFLFGWTTMITVKLILFYGAERLNFSPQGQKWFRENVRRPIIKYRIVFVIVTLGACFMLSGAFWVDPHADLKARYQWLLLLLGMTAGFVVALFLLFLADLVQSYFYKPEDASSLRYMLYPFRSKILQMARLHRRRKNRTRSDWRKIRIVEWFKAKRVLGIGYFCYDKPGTPFQGGHWTAVILFTFFLFVYAVFGSAWALLIPTNETGLWGVPAIVYLPILAAVVCWGFNAATFFLDSYRIPVLLPLTAWLFITSLFLRHDYKVIEQPNFSLTTPNAQSLTATNAKRNKFLFAPNDVAAANKGFAKTHNQNTPPETSASPESKQDYIIVVAADGGGIHAAAWTAKVLTELEKNCRKDFPSLNACANKIRLISSVSGGSVGAMYFVDAFNEEDRGLPADNKKLDDIVKRAEASSLKYVSWGLAYSDFINTLVPIIKTDRGQQLEAAWAQNYAVAGEASCEARKRLTQPFSSWASGVREGWRPAVIFNAAIAETGERLLISNTDVEERIPDYDGLPDVITPAECRRLTHKNFAAARQNKDQGSRNFYQLFPCHDIEIATAARLSSSFPYVTPTARAGLEGCEFHKYNQAHIVDGGYYDNYGIVSLLQWLNRLFESQKQLLCDGERLKKVIVINIRCNDYIGDEFIKQTSDGWYYQLFAPLSALYNVRVSGQRSRGDIEFENLKRYWATEKIEIQSVVFNFRQESDKENEEPPLSWHLTEHEKRNIDVAWESTSNQMNLERFKSTVSHFMTDNQTK